MSDSYLPTVTTIGRLVAVYVVVTAATVVVLAILTLTSSDQATEAAWWHALIVAAFAVLLPLRWRAARRGSARGLVAVGVIAVVLLVVNVVEAAIPDFLPLWMRIEMVAIAILMVAIAALAFRARAR